jgi:hypothetical protein
MLIHHSVNTMKKSRLLFILFFLPMILMAQGQKLNQPLIDSLAKWAILDQTAAGPPLGNLKLLTKEQKHRYSDSIFVVNEQRLIRLFDRYGYPGYDLVGKKGSNDFWLMVQHCDKNVDFQQKVLNKMKEELPGKNADPKNYAYLTDRVSINTGQKQIYGTQVAYNTDSCQAIPKPLEDSLNVNKRRIAISLEPIENYLDLMSQLHFEMNKSSYESRGIHHPKLLAVPERKP